MIRCFADVNFRAIRPGLSPGYSSRRGQKPERGQHLKNTVLDVCSNQGSNVKWMTQISKGGPGTTGAPAGYDLE